MRIGIDARCFSEGRRTGVEEYALNLLVNLFKYDRQNEYVLFFNSFGSPKADFSWIKNYPNVRLKIFRYPNKVLNFCLWYFNWPKLDKLLGGADLFLLPNINFAAFSRATKVLLVFHDLSFEYYAETFSLKRKLWHWFINPKKLGKRANKILAVSESTRNDLVNFYGINRQKISVVYSGVAETFRVMNRNDAKLLKIKEKYNLPYKFMLYLGTIEPRKNIVGIIRAYNQLRKLQKGELEKYKLVVAGERGWKDKKIFAEIQKSPYQNDIIFCGFIEDENKSYVYNLAELFIYPSFFEGFGFPPLEAMASGVPVIASNNSSLPEIVGNAGILIDPDKPDEICSVMKEILLNKKFAEKLKEKGIEQAKKFNWAKTAEEVLKLINLTQAA